MFLGSCCCAACVWCMQQVLSYCVFVFVFVFLFVFLFVCVCYPYLVFAKDALFRYLYLYSYLDPSVLFITISSLHASTSFMFIVCILVSVKVSQGWAIQVQANMFVMCVLLLLQICARYLLWVPKKRKQSIKNHPFSQIKQKIKNPSFYRMVPQEPFQPFQPGSILQTLSGWFPIITREMLILIKAYIICALQVNVMRIHAL